MDQSKSANDRCSHRRSHRDMVGAKLFCDYRRHPGPDTRNRLIEHYFSLVVSSARRIVARIGPVVRTEELIGAGVFGLVDAIEEFDEGQRVKFSTYSAFRIRGAMLDELRAMDRSPRRVRTRARRLEAAARELEMQLGRRPSDDELATRLELDNVKFREWSRDARLAEVRSLSKAGRAGGADDRGEMPLPADPASIDPARAVQRRMLRQVLLRSLSRAERLAITLYYYEDLTMREIGGVLDLSESRVSQMLTSVRTRLRAALGRSRPTTPDELAA